MTKKYIAAETGLSVDTVRFYLRRAGIPTRRVGYTLGRKQLDKLRRQGLSSQRIADEFGCSRTTVERVLRR